MKCWWIKKSTKRFNQIEKQIVGKLKPVPVDLTDVVDNDVVKKTVYDLLVKKVNAIDTTKLVNKTDCDAKIKDIVDKYLVLLTWPLLLLLILLRIRYQT